MSGDPSVDWYSFALSALDDAEPSSPSHAPRRAAGSDSNGIVVPHRALVPPSRLPKRGEDYWSGYHIQHADQLIPVPENAIARISPFFEPPPLGACLGCGQADCSHGWALPDPRAVVVLVAPLRAREGQKAYGWFVRFTFTPTTLVRIPQRIVALLIMHMTNDPLLHDTPLLSMTATDNRAFAHRVGELFLLRKQQQQCTRLSERKRKRIASTVQASPSSPCGNEGTCVVCLDAARTHLMHPCGHLSMCETCAGALMEKVLPKCPICRKDVDSVVKVWR